MKRDVRRDTWMLATLFWVVVVSAIWYSHSLERVHRLGYDFTIYYVGPAHPGWLYAPWTTIFFEPLRIFSHDTAFTIHYVASALAYCTLVLALYKRVRYGAVWLGLAGVYPYLLSQELGNISVVLAALCLTFPGAILASCIKPYCAGVALLHAVLKLRRNRAARLRNTRPGNAWDGHPLSRIRAIEHAHPGPVQNQPAVRPNDSRRDRAPWKE